MSRFNEVRETPKDAGAIGALERLERVERLVSVIPEAILDLFNAEHLRAEKSGDLWEAMIFWHPKRKNPKSERHPAVERPRGRGVSLLDPLLPLYSIPPSVLPGDRRLIRTLNTLEGVAFKVDKIDTTSLLPLHYLAALLRAFVRCPRQERLDFIVLAQDALRKAARHFRDFAPTSLVARKSISNCEAAVAVLRWTRGAPNEALDRLRCCPGLNCPAPYFLDKSPNGNAKRCRRAGCKKSIQRLKKTIFSVSPVSGKRRA